MASAFELADRYVDDAVELDPVVATYLGVPGANHLWGDGFGPEGQTAASDLRRRYRDLIARHLDAPDPAQRISARVMATGLDEDMESHAAGDHMRTLRHLGSPYHRIKGVFNVMGTSTQSDHDNVVARLETISEPLADYRRLLQDGIDAGITVAIRQVRSVADQAEATAADTGTFDPILGKLESSGHGSERLIAAADRARLALGDFGEWLRSDYLPHAVDHDAVGKDLYLRAADRLVGRRVQPDEDYEWGWQEFNRLRGEMEQLASQIRPGVGVDGVKEFLETDPAVTAQGTDALLDFVERKLAQAVDDLAGVHFDVPDPIRPLTVQLEPPGSPLGVHYVRPSEDLIRPGGVWYSVGDQQVFPLYQHVSTAYHEGFPGHHLQIATAMSRHDEMSRYQRVFTFYPGYGEGWAMYAEVLMGELGYLDDPTHYFGMLAKQMYRASRVVIDIGLHLGKTIDPSSPIAPGEPWSFATAVEFMTEYGFRTPAQAKAEVLRYLGWPGQAIAYKLGEREILSIRDAAQRRLGDRFDLRGFHSTMLNHGPMRLELLREVMAQQQNE